MKRRIIFGVVGILIGYLIYLVIYFLTLEPMNAVLGAAIPLVIGAVFFLLGGKPAVQAASSVAAAPDAAQGKPRPSYSMFIFFLVVILVGGVLMVSILGGSLELLSGMH